MLRVDPNSWLLVIEPEPALFEDLVLKVFDSYADILDRVLFFPVGIGNHEGLRLSPFNVYKSSECGSFVWDSESTPEPIRRACGYHLGQKLLPTISLDTLLQLLPFARLSVLFLKIDAEGAGLDVLQSLGAAIDQTSLIKVELEDNMIEPAMKYLNERGFHLDVTQVMTGPLRDLQYDDVLYRAHACREETPVSCGCRFHEPWSADCYFYNHQVLEGLSGMVR